MRKLNLALQLPPGAGPLAQDPDRRPGPAGRRLSPDLGAKVALTGALLAASLCAANANASCSALGAHAIAPLTQAASAAWQSSNRASVLQAGAPSDGDGDHDDSLVGLWHTYFLSGGQVFDEGFDQFTSDNLEILNDTAPPQPANGAGTVCLGVYKKIGKATFKLKHPFWSFDGKGMLFGTGVILEQIVLDKEGESYGGTFSFITYDLNGGVTSQTSGELRARRITP